MGIIEKMRLDGKKGFVTGGALRHREVYSYGVCGGWRGCGDRGSGLCRGGKDREGAGG